jgi:hypothetical protein
VNQNGTEEVSHLPGIERVLELLQPAVGSGADGVVGVVVQRRERLLHCGHRLSLHGSDDPSRTLLLPPGCPSYRRREPTDSNGAVDLQPRAREIRWVGFLDGKV